MLVLGTYVTLFVYWGTGPQWPYKNGLEPNCKERWWTDLLYINNFVSQSKGVHFNYSSGVIKITGTQ